MKPKKLLIVDDDDLTRLSITQAFKADGWKVFPLPNGHKALETVRRERPDVVLLDVLLPGISGFEVCRRLREMADSRHLPILLITVKHEVPSRVEGLLTGADDYILKPFDMGELKARVSAAYRRSHARLSANPITHLPGGPLIEEEATHRIAEQVPFVLAYIDIDRFKAYNDIYGYHNGDKIITTLGRIMAKSVSQKGKPGDFCGHVGGDDFVLILSPGQARKVLDEVSSRFDRAARSFYSLADRRTGYITTKDRRGETRKFALATLSIGAVSTKTRDIQHYARLVEIATEMKNHAKSHSRRRKSLYLFDKRKDK